MVKKWKFLTGTRNLGTKFLTDSHDLLAASSMKSSQWKEYAANSSAPDFGWLYVKDRLSSNE